MEHAAKSGNTEYVDSNWPYHSKRPTEEPEEDSEEDVDAATSKTNAANAGYAIEQTLASGKVGEDAKYYIANIIKNYSPGMNDAYIQWLLDTYGLSQEELEYYTQ